jgi:Tol biopolymer transport system component
MGEVYKARDTRLDRTVALKILPDALAADPHFRDRFDREARSISQLDHPHICALYDVGDQGGTAYLVMQYLEGETLADRLAKGALPIDQALQVAIQIADALVAAHRAGIVHRDLKPGNIMLSKTGAKLLDFGLAKTGAFVGAPSQSIPTALPITQPGSILGTFQYMAPEQIEGQEADARTDVFAFGVVVYEMVTGKKAFAGTTSASLIGAILKDQPPPLSTVQPVTPAALDRTVRRCLAKEPDARWQSARDLLEELKWIAAEGERVAPAAATRVRRRVRDGGLVLAAFLVGASLTILAMHYLRPAPESFVTRFNVVTPQTSDPFSFAVSPDGRQVAFVATDDKTSRLWVRPFDSENARPLAGTEGANYPFWKPDSRAIGFFANGKLKIVDTAGGVPRELTSASNARGGTWNQDGVIVFAPRPTAGLMRIAATPGGTLAEATHLAPGQGGSHRWPQFLPDGRRFLFLSTFAGTSPNGVYLGSLDGREPTRLLSAETAAVYTPPGYLLRVINGTLVAHPFNPDSGVVSPDSVPVAQSVGTNDLLFRAAFSVSPTALAHRAGGAARPQLVWVDRAGKITGTVGPPDDTALSNPALAPDGRRVAVNRIVQGNDDIYINEIAGGGQRFTFDPELDVGAVWSPEGNRIVFRSNRNGKYDLFEKGASGASDEQPLLLAPHDQNKVALDWSPDGRFLLYDLEDPTTGYHLWALPLTGEGKPSGNPFPVVRTNGVDREGQFSPPHGRWVAYVSNESGIDEVYVQPFPGPGAKRQASTNGGVDPRWARDGRELFYVAPDGKLMAVAIHVEADGALKPGSPIGLFPTRFPTTGVNIATGTGGATPQYAVAPDGGFLMNVTVDDNVVSPISIVLNWATLLKK